MFGIKMLHIILYYNNIYTFKYILLLCVIYRLSSLFDSLSSYYSPDQQSHSQDA